MNFVFTAARAKAREDFSYADLVSMSKRIGDKEVQVVIEPGQLVPAAPKKTGGAAAQAASAPPMPKEQKVAIEEPDCPFRGESAVTRLNEAMLHARKRSELVANNHMKQGSMAGSVMVHAETAAYSNPTGGTISGGHHFMQLALLAACEYIAQTEAVKFVCLMPQMTTNMSADLLIGDLEVEVKPAVDERYLTTFMNQEPALAEEHRVREALAKRDGKAPPAKGQRVLVSWNMVGYKATADTDRPAWDAYRMNGDRVRMDVGGRTPEENYLLKAMLLVQNACLGPARCRLRPYGFPNWDHLKQLRDSVTSEGFEPLYKRLTTAHERITQICPRPGKARQLVAANSVSGKLLFLWNTNEIPWGKYPSTARKDEDDTDPVGAYQHIKEQLVPARLDQFCLQALALTDPKVVGKAIEAEVTEIKTDLGTDSLDLYASCGQERLEFKVFDVSAAPELVDDGKSGKAEYKPVQSFAKVLCSEVKQRDATKAREPFLARVRDGHSKTIPVSELPEKVPLHKQSLTREGLLGIKINQAVAKYMKDFRNPESQQRLANLQTFWLGITAAYRVMYSGAVAQPLENASKVTTAICGLGKRICSTRRELWGAYYRKENATRCVVAQDWSKLDGINPTDCRPWCIKAYPNCTPRAAPYLIGTCDKGVKETPASATQSAEGALDEKFTFAGFKRACTMPVYKSPAGCAPELPTSATKTMPVVDDVFVADETPYRKHLHKIYKLIGSVVKAVPRGAEAALLEKDDLAIPELLKETCAGHKVEEIVRANYGSGLKGEPEIPWEHSQGTSAEAQRMFLKAMMLHPKATATLAHLVGGLKALFDESRKEKAASRCYPTPTNEEWIEFAKKETEEDAQGKGLGKMTQDSMAFTLHTAKCISALERSNTYRPCGAFVFGEDWVMVRAGSSGVMQAKDTKEMYVRPDTYIEVYWGDTNLEHSKGWSCMNPKSKVKVWFRMREWSDLDRTSWIGRACKDAMASIVMRSKPIELPGFGLQYEGGSQMTQCTMSRLILYGATQVNRLAQDAADAANYACRGGAYSSNITTLCDGIMAKGTNLPWLGVFLVGCRIQAATCRGSTNEVQMVMSLNTISGTEKAQTQYANRLGNVEAQLKMAYDSISSVYPGWNVTKMPEGGAVASSATNKKK